MSLQRLLPNRLSTCLWLALTAYCLPGCAPPLAPSNALTQPWPTHGNQYYNYWDAKYLGSDSAARLSYRLIDSATFEDILHRYDPADSNAIRVLCDSSHPITIDSSKIQEDLQWIRDFSVRSRKEYQIYLFIDRNTGRLSSLHGEPGTARNSHPHISSDRNHGMVSPIPLDSPMNSDRILIGQVHGHPALSGEQTLQRMSPDDTLTAICLQAPVYAIDAMDGQEGTPGAIHRANPNPGGQVESQSLHIGRTWGTLGFGADSLLDIGLNALQIWGITRRPDFDGLRRIDSSLNAGLRQAQAIPQTRHGFPARPSSRPRSL
jgi:hypothetical protein